MLFNVRPEFRHVILTQGRTIPLHLIPGENLDGIAPQLFSPLGCFIDASGNRYMCAELLHSGRCAISGVKFVRN